MQFLNFWYHHEYLLSGWELAQGCASRLLSIVRQVFPWQQKAAEGKETDSHPHKAWMCGLIKRFCAQGHLGKEQRQSETRGHKGVRGDTPRAPRYASRLPPLTSPLVRSSQVFVTSWLDQIRKSPGCIFLPVDAWSSELQGLIKSRLLSSDSDLDRMPFVIKNCFQSSGAEGGR